MTIMSALAHETTEKSGHSATTQKLKLLSNKTKEKGRRVLHLDNTEARENNLLDEGNNALESIESDPAFNPGLVAEQIKNYDGPARKTGKSLRSVANAVIHPRKAITSKATKATAGKLSTVERPYISRKADLELLEAHDGLDQTCSSDNQETSPKGFHKKLEKMEASRASSRIAWQTSEHIRRVRVVPKLFMKFPDKAKFQLVGGQGGLSQFDWLKWLGYSLIYYTQSFSAQYIDDFDELPFDIDSLRHHVERLVVASAPWQSWFMKLRSVWRWENPRTTGKWLALYVCLWYTEHVMGFLYGYVVYIVVKNRYFPTSIVSLRESMQRALDNESTAYRIGELIDKHGSNDWLEPLIAKLGPQIQLQIGDMANLLEVFYNFYHWVLPRKTICTLVLLAACFLLTVLTDMVFCMKIFWFVVGGGFFLCWPIASLHPKYRYLVSPFKWMLWDVPTDAEWSFQYLRRQAQINREQMIQRKVDQSFSDKTAHSRNETYKGRMTISETALTDNDDTDGHEDDWHSTCSSNSILDASDLMSFRAYAKGTSGRLIVCSDRIRFIQSKFTKELWNRPYLELVEMRKLEGSIASKFVVKTAPQELELKFSDGTIVLLQAMKNRDKAFNVIIGFSSLRWQALQTNPTKAAKTTADDK